jgi:hypothetical protein
MSEVFEKDGKFFVDGEAHPYPNREQAKARYLYLRQKKILDENTFKRRKEEYEELMKYDSLKY